MKKIIKPLLIGLLLLGAAYGILYRIDNKTYTNWTVEASATEVTDFDWAPFEWSGDSLSGRYFDKAAMMIPCHIEGLLNCCTFQLDLGADVTGVYEKTFNSLQTLNPELPNKIKRLKSKLRFWNKSRYFENFTLYFSSYRAKNEVAYIFEDYGEILSNPQANDTIHLGTIGIDVFKDKVLMINYPKQCFAISDEVPEEYSACHFIDIDLDPQGRVILPLHINGKTCRILFDTGSSIFPLITSANKITNFTTAPDTDTIQISSWGERHKVTGKLINDSFELAGQKFANTMIYANHSGLGIDNQTDGMAGNALFLNKTIIIDFKHKKFAAK